MKYSFSFLLQFLQEFEKHIQLPFLCLYFNKSQSKDGDKFTTALYVVLVEYCILGYKRSSSFKTKKQWIVEYVMFLKTS